MIDRLVVGSTERTLRETAARAIGRIREAPTDRVQA